MARPTDGLKHVDRLDGPGASKARLRLILAVLSGERTVGSACAELGISEARFHVLRERALHGALAGITPRAPGRPKRPPPQVDDVEELRRANADLKFALRAAEIREEIALTMPRLLKRGRGKKGGRP